MVNANPTCFKEIDPKNPPSEVSNQSLTSRECNMNKLKSGLNGYDLFNFNGTIATKTYDWSVSDFFYFVFIFEIIVN